MRGLSALQKYLTKTGRYVKENPGESLGMGAVVGLTGTGAVMGIGKTDHDLWRME